MRNRPRILSLLALATTAWALMVVPGAAQDDEWHHLDRVRVESGDAQYFATVSTSDASDRPLPLGRSLQLRLQLQEAANRTSVAAGPDLPVIARRCGGLSADPADCLDASVAFRTTLRDADDGAVDGTYVWVPVEAGLGEEGLWSLRFGGEASDSLQLRIDDEITPVGFVDRLIRLVVGTDDTFLGRLLSFALWLALFAGLAWALGRVAANTVLSPRRVDPTLGRLVIRLFGAVFFIVGFAVSLWIVWGINFWGGLAALGLLSVALGFGMQNTIANLMGGISLAVDRPFVIGDRIQVGDTWGDVQEMGLRSTRILTTKNEVVVIPNRVLDEREVWNYTISHPELRVDIDVSISYDSDRRLAEALMLKAVRGHDDILAFPRPRVMLQDFGESGLKLQLRCWINNAKDARPIASELRKKIFDAFVENGVEIPYPYRTLVEKKDTPKPRLATEEELATLRVRDERLPKLVYATAYPHPLEKTAELVALVADNLDLALVVVHILEPGAHPPRADLYRVLAAFGDAGLRHGVPVETIRREGDALAIVPEVVADQDAALLALDSRRYSIFGTPRKLSEVAREVRQKTEVPVLILPRDLKIGARTLKHYREVVSKRLMERRREQVLEPKEGEESPAKSDVAPGAPE